MHFALALARKIGLTEEGFFFALVLTATVFILALALTSPSSGSGIFDSASNFWS